MESKNYYLKITIISRNYRLKILVRVRIYARMYARASDCRQIVIGTQDNQKKEEHGKTCTYRYNRRQ